MPGRWTAPRRTMGLLHLALAVCLIGAAEVSAQVKRLEISDARFDYYGEETDNPVADLLERVASGDARLDYHPVQGYLPDLLDQLQVPVESQLLLFSKSSMQAGFVSPKTPRALYFNDDVTIGWIPNAPLIEVMAQDPVKGSIFYAIPQTESGFSALREQRCNGCHATSRSAYIPGFVLRSFETNARGGLISGRAKVTQETPVEARWGGWFITGETPQQPHRGNLIGPDDHARHREEPMFRGALADLEPLVNLDNYPVKTSDVAAALVLDHLAEAYNLLVRAGAEQRLGEEVTVVDKLVANLLMLDEAPLQGPVRSVGGFSERYAEVGPRDAAGRSLRDLGLDGRVYRWGVSPLVYSATFQQLPAEVRQTLQTEMTAYLSGEREWPETCVRTADDRRIALEILRETIADWPR